MDSLLRGQSNVLLRRRNVQIVIRVRAGGRRVCDGIVEYELAEAEERVEGVDGELGDGRADAYMKSCDGIGGVRGRAHVDIVAEGWGRGEGEGSPTGKGEVHQQQGEDDEKEEGQGGKERTALFHYFVC